jgi:hypothetical protein
MLLSGLAVLALALAPQVRAEEKEAKTVTLTGKVTCAKCDLQKADKCATVVVVKKGDDEKIYYFDTASNKKYHKGICQTPKDGTVTGTVEEKDGMNIVHVTKVKYKE